MDCPPAAKEFDAMPRPPTTSTTSTISTTSTALALIGAMQQCWLYIITDRYTGRVIYVGQTLDTTRRWKQHQNPLSHCALLRKYLSKHQAVAGDRFKIEIEPRLPNGVPIGRANEFEAVLMFDYKTLFDPDDHPDGCNQNNAPGVAEVDFDAVRKELKEGYKWPSSEEMNDALEKARAQEAMYAALVDDVGDMMPNLTTALAEAKARREGVERSFMSPMVFAEAIAADYESHCRYAKVDRGEVEKDLNALKARLEDTKFEKVQDVKMVALVKAMWKFSKSCGMEWNMSAAVAAHQFRAIAEALWTRDESRLQETAIVTKIREMRAWSVANGGEKPRSKAMSVKENPGTPEEEEMGIYLNHWKQRKQPERAACDLVMHHVGWWPEFVAKDRKTGTASTDTRLNELLKQGFAGPGERKGRPFPGMKELPCKAEQKAHRRMHNILDGHVEPGSFEDVLEGIDEGRAKWIRDTVAAARNNYLAKEAKHKAGEKARRAEANKKKAEAKKKKAEEEAGGGSKKKQKV